jgi:hypothetical protein
MKKTQLLLTLNFIACGSIKSVSISEDEGNNISHHHTTTNHNSHIDLKNSRFILAPKPEKSTSDYLEAAGWQIGTTVMTHLVTQAATDAYSRWNRPNELKAAEAIQIHSALEQQIDELRKIIIDFYRFVTNNTAHNADADNETLKKSTSLALININSGHIEEIFPIIHRLNGVQAQYKLEYNPEEQKACMLKFINEFNQLLETINRKPYTTRIKTRIGKGIHSAQEAINNNKNTLLGATDAVVLAAPLIYILANGATETNDN